MNDNTRLTVEEIEFLRKTIEPYTKALAKLIVTLACSNSSPTKVRE